jgi:hypothetical protein
MHYVTAIPKLLAKATGVSALLALPFGAFAAYPTLLLAGTGPASQPTTAFIGQEKAAPASTGAVAARATPAGQPSAVAAAPPCTLQAVAQNVRVVLGATGTVTITGAQVGSGTSADCGPVSYTIQRVVTGNVGEHLLMTLTAPPGKTFSSVPFASYGTPITNANGTYALGGCHATTSQQAARNLLFGKNTADILAENSVFGDPCVNTFKALSIIAAYSPDAPQLVFGCDDLGTTTVLLTATDAQGNKSQALATVTVTDNLLPTALAQNVTLTLGASATATPTAAQVNNGSTDNCALTLEVLAGTDKLVNGSFDTNATGWTATNVDQSGGYRTAAGNGFFVLNESGAASTDPTITQRINGLTVGASYVVRGSYRNYSGVGTVGTPAFAVDVDGSQQAALPNPGTAWTSFTVRFVAQYASQTVSFRGEINGSDIDIAVDNLTLRQLSPSYTCANLGANPVLLLATDASGNEATAAATVTVVDALAPGANTGTLPAAPATALANVPEAANYGILYQLDAPNVASFNSLPILYGINNSAALLSTPSRVAYYVELTNGTSSKWVWTSMDNFATTLAGLGIPNPIGNNVSLHQNVNNLTVYASANAGLTTGANLGTGRIEMFYSNYAQANTDGVPGADGNTYDFGDQASTGSGYGSFQVHNVGARQTVFAYNNWGVANNPSDLGIGNQVGGSGNPDWTFAYNAASYTVKRITVLVPNVAVFTKPLAVTLPASGTVTVAAADILKQAVGDNCGIASMVVTPSTLNCSNLGLNTVTLALTDASGNTTTGTAVVTVSTPIIISTTWTGTASTDWNDCRNWSYGQAPTALISAVLPGNTPNAPAVPIGTGLVKDVTIGGATGLNLGSGGGLLVYGNWTNTSTASNLNGTVSFIGLGAQTISQPGAARFGTVVVSKLTGALTLAQNMGVSTALTMTSGVLTTGGYQVQLAPTATISETELSYVTGTVATSRTIGSAAESFGGLGLVLTPAGGSVAPGATAVVRTTGTALSGAGTSKSIQRYFDIQPATNSGLNIGMTFSYFDHELNAIPKASLTLFKSTTTTSGPWASMGGTSNVITNTVTKTGLADFSIWTLGNAANPLPVALLDFTAQPQGAAVNLAWHTASEKNSARFDIERSTDGSTFSKLGAVAAQGTTSQAHAYTFRDAQLPGGATTLYYRLRQVDLDGTYTFSPVRIVSASGAGTSAGPLALFPNPTQTTATLTGAPAQVAVQVLDAVGRVVYTTTTAADGTATLSLPASLPAGVYIVRAGTQAARLTVE